MAVVIMEGLWADANRRDDWKNHVSMPLKYDYQPTRVLNDFLPDFKGYDHPYRPLALVIE